MAVVPKGTSLTSTMCLIINVFFNVILSLPFDYIGHIVTFEHIVTLLFFLLNSGEIGGQVGLCVGASLLTVLEFFDVIFSIIRIRLGFR